MNPSLKVGDLVRCSDVSDLPPLTGNMKRRLIKNERYRILRIDFPYVEVERLKTGQTTRAYHWRFTKEGTVSSKFKTGDVLIVVKSPGGNLPKDAEVSAVGVASGTIKVLCLDGVNRWYDEDRFILKPVRKTNKWGGPVFQIGDRVRFNRSSRAVDTVTRV